MLSQDRHTRLIQYRQGHTEDDEYSKRHTQAKGRTKCSLSWLDDSIYIAYLELGRAYRLHVN
jgi:hypothetical protein